MRIRRGERGTQAGSPGANRARRARVAAVLAVLAGAVTLAACGGGSPSADPSTTTTRHAVLATSSDGVRPGAPAGAVPVPIETRLVTDGAGSSSIVVVTISVAGGAEVPVQLDTGSSGLTVLSSAVGPAAQSTGQAVQIPYLSDTLVGTLATGTVTIGGLSTSAATAFVAIPASHNPAMAAHLSADGVDGILGIGMANGAALNTSWYSPLLQLPTPYWQGLTLHVARRGAGTLDIGPVSSVLGATALPMQSPVPASNYAAGVPGYQKDFVACWSTPGGSPGCGNTDIDLGAPQPIFGPGALPGAPTGSDGSTIAPGVRVSAAAPGGSTLWTYVTGTTPASGLTALEAQGYTQFNTGIGFFFSHTVAYDVLQGKFLIAGT